MLQTISRQHFSRNLKRLRISLVTFISRAEMMKNRTTKITMPITVKTSTGLNFKVAASESMEENRRKVQKLLYFSHPWICTLGCQKKLVLCKTIWNWINRNIAFFRLAVRREKLSCLNTFWRVSSHIYPLEIRILAMILKLDKSIINYIEMSYSEILRYAMHQFIIA